ncbi:rod shape-determining protein MreC [Thiocystis minor]|uniref:rod shape-determining protein MreC n=1 Tax=Thiocystis minor TaxID=61597 RepID=UPI001912B2E5|nr:rod shape-determining protein MreC [Thiocystis minor]MBK5966138.1 rod shape-determining protein MreC [Thiocystis minor]
MPSGILPRNATIKPLFVHGPSPTFRVILAEILAIGLIVADHRYHYLDTVRSVIEVAIYPLQFAANLPAQLAREAQERLVGEAQLRLSNENLQHENLVLKGRLQQFESLRAENMRLRDLLGSSFEVGERVLIAEILAVDLAPSSQQVMINKGTNSGVFAGQPVLDAEAVMGQVIRANPFSSTVLLITDANHSLPVEVNRNGLRTIAAGKGPSQELELLYIPKNADIRVGDLLVTSGMDERFPSGYPVARVKTVRQDPDNPFTTVIAEPTARLDRSREVLLVWSMGAKPDHATLAADALKPLYRHERD